jgi:hypothetical protein
VPEGSAREVKAVERRCRPRVLVGMAACLAERVGGGRQHHRCNGEALGPDAHPWPRYESSWRGVPGWRQPGVRLRKG